MRLALPLIAAFALAACSRAPQGYVPHPDRVARAITSADGDIGVVVAGHNDFAFRLHASVAAEAGADNSFHSPFSVTSAFGMVLAGADGETRDELMALLGAPDVEEEAWHQALGALSRDLAGDLKRAYTLHLANKLWGQVGYPFAADFLAVCADAYDAPFETWDFAQDPEGGRAHINGWVAEQTADRIVDLLPPDSITSDTVLVAANAIYFLADWAAAFDPDDTAPRSFELLNGSRVDVPMMVHDLAAVEEHWIRGARRDGVAVLQLPYEEHEVSMVVLIPETSSLPELEDRLDASTWRALSRDLPLLEEGTIGLPKFETRAEIDLIPHLQGLGVQTAFDGRADFSRMVELDDALAITGAFHQAFVRVDEQGTEAAAATAAVIGRVSAPEPILADRPFLFVIQDDLTGAVLFVGRVMDPR